MAIPYGPTEKQGLSEKELLKVIALGQANVIRAISMLDDNAECRAGGGPRYWNEGHFDELAQNIETAVSPEDAAPADSTETPPRPRKITDWIYAGLYLAACFWLLYKAWDLGIVL